MSMVIGIPGLMILYYSRENNKFLESIPLASQISIGNVRGNNKLALIEYIWVVSIGNSLAIIGLLLFAIVLRTMLNRMNIELDKGSCTPSDFCCIVTGLPID